MSNLSSHPHSLPASADIVAALGALAHEHRLAIFRMLVERGTKGLAASEIAERLGLPLSSLTFHTQALVRAGLVGQQRLGRQIIFSANYGAMKSLMAFLTRNCCGGAPC